MVYEAPTTYDDNACHLRIVSVQDKIREVEVLRDQYRQIENCLQMCRPERDGTLRENSHTDEPFTEAERLELYIRWDGKAEAVVPSE